jgi:hypothetical protein
MANESLLTQIPENTNFLQTTKYTFSFPNLPFLRYFSQTILFPGVSLTPVPVETPFSATYRHGDKLIYDPITITAIVDEDLKVWEETYNWMKALTFPHQFSEYIKNDKKDPNPYHDGILTINTNSNIPNMRIHFENCFPTALGSIQFAVTDTADITPIVDITFQYDTFRFERL